MCTALQLFRSERLAVCPALCVIVLGALMTSCTGKPLQALPSTRPVHTAQTSQKDVPIYIDSFGTFAAFNNVDIRSKVTEQIIAVHFKEGQYVTNGQLLFSIDPTEYKAALDKARAALAEHIAELKLKEDDLIRNKDLVDKAVISKEEFERSQTDTAAAQARVALDKAEVQLQELNLKYCAVISPVDGITSKRFVDPGNIVEAYTGPVLVNIKMVDPLHVDFTIPERHLDSVRSAMAQATLQVLIFLEGDTNSPYKGELQFLDNTVNNGTGTVLLRATVPNEEERLWPGQFVHVRLITGILKNAVLAPRSAVQVGQGGHYLYVVSPSNTADYRILRVGQEQGECIVVEHGVAPGETVVTVGQLGLAPGVSVEDVTQASSNLVAGSSPVSSPPRRDAS